MLHREIMAANCKNLSQNINIYTVWQKVKAVSAGTSGLCTKH